MSVTSTPAILQLETRSAGRGNGCFPAGLVQGEELCQSFVVPDRESTGTCLQTMNSGSPNSSSVGSTTMVPTTSEDAGGHSGSSSHLPSTTSENVGPRSVHVNNATVSHLAYLRNRFSSNSLSEQATELKPTCRPHVDLGLESHTIPISKVGKLV